MPIKGDYHFEPVKKPKIKGNYHFEPAEPATEVEARRQYPEPNWPQSIISTGLSIAPPLIGMGLGGPWGGGAGGLIGSYLRQKFEEHEGLRGPGINPWEMGVEGVTSAIPPIFGSKVAGSVLKQALTHAGSSAIEGGLISAGASPFQHWAQTGEIPSLEEGIVGAGKAGVGGAVMGGVLGGTIGGYNAYRGKGLQAIADAGTGETKVPPPPPPPVMDPRSPERTVQGALDLGEPQPNLFDFPTGPEDTSFIGPEVGPYGVTKDHPRLPFTEEYKSHVDAEGNEVPDRYEGQTSFDLDLTRTPEPEYTPYGKDVLGDDAIPKSDIIEIEFPSKAQNELLRSQGYEPYGVSKRGKPQMIRRARPPADAGPTEPPTPPPVAPTAPDSEGDNFAAFEDDAEVAVPAAKANDTFIKNAKKAGLAIKRITDDGMVIFQRVVDEDEGTFDYQQMWDNLKRMLGRDPTPEEVEVRLDRQARPGEEPTGQITHFPSRRIPTPEPPTQHRQVYEIVSDLEETLRRGVQDDPNVDSLMNEVEEAIMNQTDPEIIQDNLRQIHDYVQKPGASPDEEELFGAISEWARAKARGLDKPPAQTPTQTQSVPQGMTDQIHPRMPGRVARLTDPMQVAEQLKHWTRIAEQTTDPAQLQIMQQTIEAARTRLAELQPENLPGPRLVGGLDVAGIRQRNLFPEAPTETTPVDLGPEPTPEDFDPSYQRAGKPPRGERAGEFQARIGALKHGIEEAYKAKDLKRVIELSQQLEEIMGAGNKHTMGKGPDSDEPYDGPQYARVKGGGLTASANLTRAVENITRDYTSPLPGIMNREGMQNALDAADKLGNGGEVRVRLNENENTIEIHDNGSGLDEDQLANKLVEIFASGKEGEEGATGGKGIGSASYIYGGEHFEIDTVAVDAKDGIKYRVVAGGTPQQFLDPVKGSDWQRIRVDRSTPTGTTIKVKLKPEHDISDAQYMLNNIVNNSRNRSSSVIVDEKGVSAKTPLKDVRSNGTDIVKYKFASSKDDKMVGDFTTVNRNSEIKVLIPKDPPRISDEIEIHYLNNGMYQFSEPLHLGAMAEDVPERILIDIHPLVDDQSELYPFINTREDIKRDIREEVTKYVKDHIGAPGISKRKNRIQELYDSMKPVPIQGAKRKSIIFDPGDRLSPAEMNSLTSNPIIHQLVKTYDKLIDDIITSTGRQGWATRLEGVGLVFDPGMHGIHIPNPATGKSTILINPFIRIADIPDPKTSSWKNTITNLHEVGHIGRESGTPIKLTPKDLADPRLGEFLTAYMNQLVEHGDVGFYTNTGHGMDFAHRLGEVYAKFGVDATFRAADELHGIFTGGRKSGSYSPEIQRILQLYTESRGRAAVTEDLLSGTGVKQANRGRVTKGNIPGNNPTDGVGTPAKKPGVVREAYNLSRGLTTALDLSASLRQGLALGFTKEWRTAWGKQLEALGAEGAYQQQLADIKKRKLFQNRIDLNTGKVVKSKAAEAGIKIMDVTTNLNGREEAVASNWAETGGFLGKDNAFQRGYQKTVGRAVRASNRAYTAFLNQLRADTFESLYNDSLELYKADQLAGGTKGARNPETDIPFLKELGDFINTATGRGPMKMAGPSIQGGKLGLREYSMEQNAKLLTDTIFSPRLMFSRMRMLNPATYMMASPYVRKQYVNALLRTAGIWGTMSTVAYLGGADVSLDPNSADFMKIKIPGTNTRLDPGGGFQQYLVAASRLLSGKTTSSATQQEFELGQGYHADTRKDIAMRFAANKLHPVMKFAYDILDASHYQPFHLADRTAQMFIPLFAGDVLELLKEDPALLGAAIPVGLGMGTQTYEKGESVDKFVPREYDYLFEGGAANLWK